LKKQTIARIAVIACAALCASVWLRSAEVEGLPAEPEITGDVIYVELQPPVTKDSTPPAYKPNGEPYHP
jgi:hypothetical protein